MNPRTLPFLLLTLLTTLAVRAAEDLVIADFEGGSYGDWQATGEAFGTAPATGSLPGQMPVDGFNGKGLVNSFVKGDDSTGSLTSPAFAIQRKYLAFLIGGGRNESKLNLQLLVDGKVVRSATGPNLQAGGSEALTQESWDVSEFAGKMATLRIVDDARGGWGHLNVDHIVQTDRKPAGPRKDVTRAIKARRP
ncbi:MAG: Levanase precursor, partial [Verrucomicrobiota bacterium]